MRLFIVLFFFVLNSQAKDVNLKWKAIPNAKKYKIQIATNEEFQKTLFETTTEKTLHVKDLNSGIYYLRVQAIDSKGIQGKWSPPFKLVVTAPVKPVEKEIVPESVGYEPVKTEWTAPESAPKYLVKVVKDGKEIESKQTSLPKVDFKPTTPGNYEVKVQAAFDKYFGPPVTVKKYNVRDRSVLENINTQKNIGLTWKPIENVKKYKIALFKKDDRGPASKGQPFMIIETENPKAEMGKLPAGKYIASVTTDSLQPVTEYTFDVKKDKPVEFEKIDLIFHYNIKSVEYYVRVNEAGKTSSTKTTGGEVGFEGNMQLSNSRFGLRAEGYWGNLLIDSQLISFNELKFLGTYKWSIAREFYNTEIKPFFGVRLWSMPIVLRSGGINNSNLQVLAPTFAGPALGFDVTHPLSSKWALTTRLQSSIPLTHSNLTNDGLNDPLHFTVSGKLEVGVKYGWKSNYRLLAMAGIQTDNFRYTATSGPNGSTTRGETSGDINSINASLGLEITDDGAEFSNTRSPQFDKFSEFDLGIKYALSPMSYRGYLSELVQSGQNNTRTNPQFSGAFSGNFELETKGYFPSSNHGIKLVAGWGGYTYSSLTVSYPEFLAQWAYRFDANTKKTLRFNNYFGVRSWQVPIVTIDSPQQGSEHIFSHNPQLLGAAETIEATYLLADTWKLRSSAELSIPLLGTNRDSVVDKIKIDYLSYKFDLSVIKSFNKDLSAGLSIGYKADRLSYIPLNSINSASSNVELTSPVIGLFGVYSF